MARIDQRLTPSESVVLPSEAKIVSLFIDNGGIGLLDSFGNRVSTLTNNNTAKIAINAAGTYSTSQTASFYTTASHALLVSSLPESVVSSVYTTTASWADNALGAPTASYGKYTIETASFAKTADILGVSVTQSAVTGLSLLNTQNSYNPLFLKDGKVLATGLVTSATALNGFITASSGTLYAYDPISLEVSQSVTITKLVNTIGNIWALGDNGILYFTGLNSAYQAGNGTTTAVVGTFTPLTSFAFPIADFWVSHQADGEDATRTVFIRMVSGSTSYYGVWGYNGVGQAGTGTVTTPLTTPQNIPNISTSAIVSAISSSTSNIYGHTVAKVGSVLSAAGYNAQGQLGVGGTTSINTFAGCLTNLGNTANASHSIHVFTSNENKGNTAYVGTDGLTYLAGDNTYGQVGIGNTTNQQYFNPQKTNVSTTLTGSRQMSLGPGCTVNLITGNKLFATGINKNGHWGNGTAVDGTSTYAFQIATDVKDFFFFATVQRSVTLFINKILTYNDGSGIQTYYRTFAAGANDRGQCGVGQTTTNITTFREVPLPPWEYFIDIRQVGTQSSSYNYIGYVGETNTGKVYMWGSTVGLGRAGFSVGASDYITYPIQIADFNLR